jgi:hypothetical protein
VTATQAITVKASQPEQAKGDQFALLPEGEKEPGDNHHQAEQAQTQSDQQEFLFSIHHDGNVSFRSY